MEIKINEKKILRHMSLGDLRENYRPEIPFIQRDFIIERVEKLYDTLMNYYNEYGYVHDMNLIHICYYNNKYYILDGQHRYRAYNQFSEEIYEDFNILVCFYKCDTREDYRNIFRELNDNFISSDLIIDETEMEKSEKLKEHIKDKYSNFLSNAMRPNPPNVNLNSMVSGFIKKYPNKTSYEIIDMFEKINNKLKEVIPVDDVDFNLKVIGKRSQNNLYYGYIIHKEKSGGVHNKCGRKSLPQSLRLALWNRNYLNSPTGRCYVCGIEIQYINFHAAHKIAVANGGGDNLTNLECSCASCNLTMGTMNLEEFKNEFFV